MKRLLITGATGFVGSHAWEYFAKKREYEIFGTNYGAIANLPGGVEADHLFQVNLLEEEKVKELVAEIKPDFVIHLAALSSPMASFERPSDTLTNNINIQVHLFEALLKLNKQPQKVVIIGSAEEYGLVKEEDNPINETVALKPTSPYAVSKVAQDFLGLQYYLSYKLPVVRLRPFNHTGERQPPIFVLPAFAKQVAEIEAGLAEPVIRVGNLSPVRDFTDVKDMVRAYDLALNNPEPGEVYNLGSGRGVKIETLLDKLLELAEVKIKIEVDQERVKPSDVPILVADSSKFGEATGWKIEIPLEETIKRVLDYWRLVTSSTKKQ